MSEFLISLFSQTFWYNFFGICFFGGLVLTIYIIFGAVLHEVHHDSDGVDGDSDGLDGEGLDGDMAIDHDLDFDHDMQITHDISVHDIHDPSNHYDNSYELKSQFKLGNFSIFFLFFGQTGWLYRNSLTDGVLIAAVVIGIISKFIFSFIIEKYTKTVIQPIVVVQRGDIAEVIGYQITQEKAAKVNVKLRDGSISPVMAKGAYPTDLLEKGDLGYILGKKESYYIITRGSSELEKKEQREKKKSNELNEFLR